MLHQEAIAVITHGLLTQVEHRGDVLYAHVLGSGEQSVNTFDQSQSAIGIRLLKTTIELLAREGTEV
jgi:hypothetical protein